MGAPKTANVASLLKKGDGKHAVGGSLSLTIRGESKRWEYQFRDPVTGKLTSRYWPATGPAAIGLSDARAERNRVWLANREERREAHSSTHAHGDPRQRRQKTQDRTFYDAVWSHLPTEKEAAQGRRGGFLAIHAGEWSDASREKYNRALRKHAAPLHQMRCSEIGQNDVVAVLSPIWIGPSWGQGTMLRGLIERVLMQEGRNPNPAAWSGVDGLEHVMPGDPRIRIVKQRTATSLDDIPALFAKLNADGSMAARVAAFTMLTACRVSEVVGARYEEIDRPTRTWTLSAEGMKAVKPHTVMLSDAALKLIGDGTSGPIFLDLDRKKALAAMQAVRPGASLHGLRSSFKDFGGKQRALPEVIELCLAHKVESATAASYGATILREGERRELMDAWAKFCTGH
jgi:integrase